MELSKGIIAPWINAQNQHWMVYDTASETFVDSGVSAAGDGTGPQGPEGPEGPQGKSCQSSYIENGCFYGTDLPINQRGQTIYNAGSSSIPVIDRWKLNGGSLTIGDYGISFTQGNVLYQMLTTRPHGITLTFSCVIAGETFSLTGEFREYTRIPNTSLEVLLNRGNKILYIRAAEAVSLLERVFLEDGETSSIWAWVPEYSQELAACQKHLFALGGIMRVRAGFVGPSLIQFTITKPAQFDASTAPQLINDSNFKIRNINSAQDQEGFTFEALAAYRGDTTLTINAHKENHGMTDAQLCITSAALAVLVATDTFANSNNI